MPRDDAGGTQPIEAKGVVDGLFARLTDAERESFSPEQMTALVDAAEQCAWRKHPIDIRLSLPLLLRRFYLVVVAGPERRNPDRRVVEQMRFPVNTPNNFLFVLAVATLGTIIGAACFTAAAVWFLTN